MSLRGLLPADYTKFLRRGALNGARIGIDRRYFTAAYGGEPDLVRSRAARLAGDERIGSDVWWQPIRAIRLRTTSSSNDEFTVLLFEFKVQIAEYLAGLTNTTERTLADLIAFNIEHCSTEMRYFGQEIFELAEATSGNLLDPVYLAARWPIWILRATGIDLALARDDLDAIVAPSYSFASSPAAVAGYPDISIPVGLTPKGKPAGLWMYSGYLQEPKLLAYAYDLEQAIHPRTQPKFLGTIPPEPPKANICDTSGTAAAATAQPATTRRLPYHLVTGKPLPK